MPVNNAQSTLARDVAEYLEILPDLTGRFELMIVDDGSTDDTIEVADELAIEYPQIRVARHQMKQGRLAAIRTGLTLSRGDVVFLRDASCALPLSEMRQLWNAIEKYVFVLGRPASQRRSLLPTRNEPPTGGFQMFRRLAGQTVLQSLADQPMLRAALARRGQSWREVDIRPAASEVPGPSALGGQSRRRPMSGPASPKPSVRRSKQPAGPSADTVQHRVATCRPGRPNYLGRLKDFALGE